MKKVIIIGGGIAGLSAGVYAQLNGFDSTIIEKNSIIGGECIGWEREGCYVDGCIHWLTGSNSSALNDIWKRVGALENVNIIEPDYLYQYQHKQTKIFIYKNIEKFKAELLSISPEDSEQIDELIGFIEAAQNMSMPLEPIDQMNLLELMKLGKSMMPVSKLMKSISRISIGEYAKRFKSEVLRKFMLSYMPDSYQLLSFIFSISTFVCGNGNIPEGSSMDFSNRIRDKYLSLGGKIQLNTTVSDISVINKKARRVITSKGESIECDYIIPACDVDVVYHKILKGSYNDKAFEQRYQDEKNYPIMGNCYFSFAIDSDVAKTIPHMTMIECDDINVCNKVKTLIGLKIYNYLDNGNGLTTAITPLLQDGQDYEYWDKLYKDDRAKYKAEKVRIGEEIKKQYILQYPQLEEKIKLIDIATPVT